MVTLSAADSCWPLSSAFPGGFAYMVRLLESTSFENESPQLAQSNWCVCSVLSPVLCSLPCAKKEIRWPSACDTAKVSWEKVTKRPEIVHFRYHLVMKSMQGCSQTASFCLWHLRQSLISAQMEKKPTNQPKTRKSTGFFSRALLMPYQHAVQFRHLPHRLCPYASLCPCQGKCASPVVALKRRNRHTPAT